MLPEERQGAQHGAQQRDGWYFIKGIPIAVILTLVGTVGTQTVAFAIYLSKLDTRVQIQGERQVEHGTKLEKTDTKVDLLIEKIQSGVPAAAVNGRRLDEIDRSMSDYEKRLSEFAIQIRENDRRIASLEARVRAANTR